MSFNQIAKTQSQSHFAEAVHTNIRRSTFNRNSSLKTTFNAGDLVPIYIDEILPADTVEFDMASLVRLATPLFPTMDEIYLDFYAFFVPNRIVWDNWQALHGENKDGFWAQSDPAALVPSAVMNNDTSLTQNIEQGDIGDYYGLPRGATLANTEITSLPFRGYAEIWNEWFRDQNHQAPVVVTKGDTEVATSTYAPNMPLYRVNKPHDYFTSALPATQKGDSAGVSLGSAGIDIPSINIPSAWLPVYTRQTYGFGVTNIQPFRTPEANTMQSDGSLADMSTLGRNTGMWFRAGNRGIDYLTTGLDANSSLALGNGFNGQNASFDIASTGLARQLATSTSVVSGTPSSSDGFGDNRHRTLNPDNLWARSGGTYIDGERQYASIQSAMVNDIRLAFQLQRLLEKDARGGTRYIEMLKAHFNVEAEDYRLQRPEYLGHAREMIDMTQIADTAGTNEQLATLGAYSMTPFRKEGLVKKTFVEHGFMHVFAVARHRKTYQQGVERFWFRRDRFDFYYPALAHIAEQPVYTKEIYFRDDNGQDGGTDNTVFGYQEAWADYRFKPNRTSAGFRSQVGSVGLDAWHFGDVYSDVPLLSNEWVTDNSDTNIARTLAVGKDIQDQFLADFAFRCKMTRPMPIYSVPGMIDHF